MTTTADALEVMTIVAACHHRTAPRMDDREVALATAKIWGELLDGYEFSTAELVAAVKKRAKSLPDAPEPADIIRVARATRTDHMARTPLIEADTYGDDGHYPGDAKAAPDFAEYPADWDADQRRKAYWYAVKMRAWPRTTASWEALGKQLKDEQVGRAEILASPAATRTDAVAEKIAAARQSLDAEALAAVKAKREAK